MNILKSQKNKFTNKINKLITIGLNNYHNNSFNNLFDKRQHVISKKKFSTITKNENKQLDEKVNILSKHKFDIPERFRLMSSYLKILFLHTDFPYYYQFQQSVYQMINSRNNDYNITLGRGDFFFMKNILLILIENSIIQFDKNNNKINNVIICVNKNNNFRINMNKLNSLKRCK